MGWLEHGAVFIGALALLVKSADWLVEYGARLARRLGVSDLVIGLTLTSVGTSIPELAASVSASLQNNPGIIMGNVVGSNIANIGLIGGIAALVRPFRTEPRMHERDGYVLLASSVLLMMLALNNRIGRIEAFVMLAIYIGYVTFVAKTDRYSLDHRFRFFLQYITSMDFVRPLSHPLRAFRPGHPGNEVEADPNLETLKASGETSQTVPGATLPQGLEGRWLIRELLTIGASCVGVVLGANFLIREATWGATVLGIPDSIIALSLIAFGTSLPELLVAVSAARRGNAGMVVGNVMGSNLANSLLITGLAGSVMPIEVAEVSVVYTIPCMLFFTVGLLYSVRSGWRITRLQGATALSAYFAFLAAAFLGGWR